MADPRIVCIGGGHGLSAALGASRQLSRNVTAVVTVADDGGSSGVLRTQLGIAPPGDLRMALAALAGDPERAALLQYRFKDGELAGHPLGNLLIAALADIQSDLVRALDGVGVLAQARGRVLPAATVPLTLHASVDGEHVIGQVAVATSGGPIDRVWVEPARPATPEAVKAVRDADLVILGPGSLFTSVLATLVVPGIGEAAAAARRTIFIMNLLEQPGETPGLDARAHVDALRRHVQALRLAAVIAHEGAPHPRGVRPIAVDPAAVVPVPVISGDVAVDGLHDADKLAAVLKTVL
jgi:uncharacterized cofD-like protein